MSVSKIVTVCVQGDSLTSTKHQEERINLLHSVLQTLKMHGDYHPLDAVVFPGGFFYSDKYLGEKDFEGRKASLEDMDFSAACKNFVQELSSLSPGLKLVTGVDSTVVEQDGNSYGGDQLVVAYNSKGITALGRKVFPVAEDVDGKRMPPMIVYQNDFESENRTLQLASGHTAILCSCYDMFGISARFNDYSPKLNKIHLMKDKEGNWITGTKDLAVARRQSFDNWKHLLDKNNVDAGISAVHRFKKPGREVFWQRHGIASASAALGSQFAAAAAHYAEKLPVLPENGSLVSDCVPAEHLGQSSHRKAHALPPVELVSLDKVKKGFPNAVIRVFECS